MSKRTKRQGQPPPERPLPLNWAFGPNMPTSVFFDGLDLRENVGEAVESFVFFMEENEFLAWEAVMAQEQGLALTRQQQGAVDELFSFNDANDRVFYINDVARPSEPWYAILNRIVPHLLIDPFRTFDIQAEEQCEGWGRLVECLRECAGGLSLPTGVPSALEVVPAELRHKLWLQDCFDALSGLGQEDELTLHREEQESRIDELVDALREHKESVRFFDLTLDSLLTKVIVPEGDRPILVQKMQNRLGMKSTSDRIADYL